MHAEFKGLGCELILAKGDTEPYQGWVSTGYLELTPAHTVSALCPAKLIESEWLVKIESIRKSKPVTVSARRAD